MAVLRDVFSKEPPMKAQALQGQLRTTDIDGRITKLPPRPQIGDSLSPGQSPRLLHHPPSGSGPSVPSRVGSVLQIRGPPSSSMNPFLPPLPSKHGQAADVEGTTSLRLKMDQSPSRYDAPLPLPSPDQDSQPKEYRPRHSMQYTDGIAQRTIGAQGRGPGLSYSSSNLGQGTNQQVYQDVQRSTLAQRDLQGSFDSRTWSNPVPSLPYQHGQQTEVHTQFQALQPKVLPRPDLLSAAFDPSVVLVGTSQHIHTAAQLPPQSPEKNALLQEVSIRLQARLEASIAQTTAALPALHAQNTAMKHACATMQAEIAQLAQLDAMLSSNEKILTGAMRDAERVVEGVAGRALPAVDDVLIAPTVVGEQLYGLVADEKSVADALHLLVRALDKGRISGDVLVKVRSI